MNDRQIKTKIEALLSKGETQEVIGILLERTQGSKRQEVIILSNRFSEMKRRQRMGLISFKEEQLEINNINHSLLQIKDLLNNEVIRSELNENNIENRLPKSNLAQITLAICAVITLFCTVYYNSCGGNRNSKGEEKHEIRREVEGDDAKKNIPSMKSTQTLEMPKIERYDNQEELKENNELAIEHLLSGSIYEDNAFDKLVLDRQFEKIFMVLDLAESRTKDESEIKYIENRRKSMYLVKEHDIDNAWVSFPRTMILTKKDSKYGLFDRAGNEISKPKFEEIDPVFFGNLYCTTLKGMYGFYNEKGEEIFEPIFSEVNPELVEEMIFVKKDSLSGFLNEDGDYIIEPIYKEIQRVWSDIIITNKGGKWGAIDLKGKTIIENKYQKLEYIRSEGVFYAVNEGKGEYVDRGGKVTKNPGLN